MSENIVNLPEPQVESVNQEEIKKKGLPIIRILISLVGTIVISYYIITIAPEFEEKGWLPVLLIFFFIILFKPKGVLLFIGGVVASLGNSTGTQSNTTRRSSYSGSGIKSGAQMVNETRQRVHKNIRQANQKYHNDYYHQRRR